MTIAHVLGVTLICLGFVYEYLYIRILAILLLSPRAERWRAGYRLDRQRHGLLGANLRVLTDVAKITPQCAWEWVMADTVSQTPSARERLVAAGITGVLIGALSVLTGMPWRLALVALLMPGLGAGLGAALPSFTRWLFGQPGRRRHRWSLVLTGYATFLLGSPTHPEAQIVAFFFYAAALWTGQEDDPWKRWSLGGAKGRELLARMQAVWGPLQPLRGAA